MVYAETLAPSTMAHRVAGLSFAHQVLRLNDPIQDIRVKKTLSGIRKDRAELGWSKHQAPALTLEELRAVVDAIPLLPAITGIGRFNYLLAGESLALTTQKVSGHYHYIGSTSTGIILREAVDEEFLYISHEGELGLQK